MSDDLLRHGLLHLLSRVDRFDFVGDVRRDGSLVDHLRALRPELLLMCADDAPPLAELLDQLDPRPKVVIVTDGAGDGATALRLIRAGADALVDRRSSASELLSTVARVASGQTALDSSSVNTVIAELRSQQRERDSDGPESDGSHSDGVASLTRREREVLTLLTDGLDNRTIARDLFISEATVKFHLHNIMDKFGVRKRSALVSAVLRGHIRRER
jgi:DNA-binding NarL/FixJ family response regulator